MMEKSRAHPPKNGTRSRSISPPPQNTRRKSCSPPPDMSPLRVVLLGKTGSGKSASGNNILGREAFEKDFSLQSVTKTCSNQHTVVDGRQITVIDTPGLFEKPMEELRGELEKCVEMSLPGPHAFLLVIRLDARFTEEERNAVKLIQENFGDGVLKYTIVLFTHGDVLEGKPVEGFLSESPALSSLTEECGGRYHVFNNKSADSTQVRELKEKIEAMVEENGGANYTNEMYNEAQRRIREKERRQKAEEEVNAAKRKMVIANTLKKNFEKEMCDMEELRQKYEKLKRQFEEEKKKSSYLFWAGVVVGAPFVVAATVLRGGPAALGAAAVAAVAAVAAGAGAGAGAARGGQQLLGVTNAVEAASAANTAAIKAIKAGNSAAKAEAEAKAAEKELVAARVKLAVA